MQRLQVKRKSRSEQIFSKMTRFQYINENIDKIREEIKIGLISTTVLSHFAIYSRYDYYRKLGNYVCLAIMFTSDNCQVSESLIYKVIHEMEEEI